MNPQGRSVERLRESLFRSQAADLASVYPDRPGVVVCPICFREFHAHREHNPDLTVGHVWPRYLRKKTRGTLAASQRVLLCKKCNSTMGSGSDKQVQLLEQIKEGDETGNYFGERWLEILPASGTRPIVLSARLRGLESPTQFRITFSRNRNKPDNLNRFLALSACKERFSIIVPPYHGLDVPLAQIGLLASAYLLAFYQLGYRYILDEMLNPVRYCILSSFGGDCRPQLKTLQEDGVDVRMCSIHFSKDPEMGLVMPLDGTRPVHLQVNFLDYHIDLPFHGIGGILESLVRKRLQGSTLANELTELAGKPLYARIECNWQDAHDCMWQYVLGKLIPAEGQV